MAAPTRIGRIRQMVKRFTKTCRHDLTKLAGMISATDQKPRPTSIRGKSAIQAHLPKSFVLLLPETTICAHQQRRSIKESIMAKGKLFNQDNCRKRSCRFIAASGGEIDYKDINVTQRFSVCSTKSWISATWAKSSRSKTAKRAETAADRAMTPSTTFQPSIVFKAIDPESVGGGRAADLALHTDVAVGITVTVYGAMRTSKNWAPALSRMKTGNQGKLPTNFHPISPAYPQPYPKVFPYT